MQQMHYAKDVSQDRLLDIKLKCIFDPNEEASEAKPSATSSSDKPKVRIDTSSASQQPSTTSLNRPNTSIGNDTEMVDSETTIVRVKII